MTDISEWLRTAAGRKMNPDGHYGLQCVDAVDLYAEEIFGIPWPRSVGGVAGARQLLDVAPDEFWIRIDYAHGLVPQRGDVLVYAGDQYNEWGHTAIVESADQVGINVIQQDGFAAPHQFVDGAWYSDKPAHRARLAYRANGTGPLKGWLRPRHEKLTTISLQGSVTSEPQQQQGFLMALSEQDQDNIYHAISRIDKWLTEGGPKAAVESALNDAAVLDRIALAVLKRPCNLVDPVTGQVSGTTTLARKINWMAHNDQAILSAVVDVSKKLEVAHPTLPAETAVAEVAE